MPKKHKYTNDLILETSPYLLQHAHNPVQWHAWNDATLALAKKEHKMLLISIGYAACHWCHVMERESFEDETIAQLMNDNFICVKVDREERPDIDQIYMDAVQLLTGRGGWPLNCVALPDGRPFWGGTYFPKEKWENVLTEIANLWKEDPQKIKLYASQLTEGIINNHRLVVDENKEVFTKDTLAQSVAKWKTALDYEMGGQNRAPKFPMPNNYLFLLRYAVQTNDKELLEYVNTTLTKMAYGGIYDQIGGGFSRYSTDMEWHIPHFEKMLYDNAQLVSLYADAYLLNRNDLYKEVVYETLNFVERELTSPEGVFYSSLDADSYTPEGELEEGVYYVWNIKQLKDLLEEEEYKLFKDYYNINNYGLWEDDKYVLIRSTSNIKFAINHKIDIGFLEERIIKWKQLLLKNRSSRNKPRLDDKVLTSWNSLMVKAYLDAYRVFGEERFLKIAEKNNRFYLDKIKQSDGRLYRNYKDGKVSINAYLEDYASMIATQITFYEVSFDESYLVLAKDLTDYVLDHFMNSTSNLLFFTSDTDAKLISRKIDISDNVIPSSNSIMGLNLFKLSHYFDNSHYNKLSNQMLLSVLPSIESYPPGYSNWLQLALNSTDNYYEVVISGSEALEKLAEINSYYIPNKLVAGNVTQSEMPLLQNRFTPEQTFIYICIDKACQLPVEKVYDAVAQLKVGHY